MSKLKLPESESTRFNSYLITVVAVIAVLLVTPVAVLRLLEGSTVIFIVDMVIVIFAIGCSVAARLSDQSRIPGIAMSLGVCAGTLVAASITGISGAVWIFPVMMFTFYLCPRKLAFAAFISTLIVIALLDRTISTTIFSDPIQQISFYSAGVAAAVFSAVFARRTERQHAKLMQWATRDALTGLENRRSLDHELEIATATDRRHGLPFGLMIIDIDKFKPLNDELGHFEADLILQRFADLLHHVTRIEDRIFRYGGDEFIVILPNSNETGTVSAAEHIRTEVQERFTDTKIPLTVSIGSAVLHYDETASSWLERADACLYEAKRRGGNCVVTADLPG